MLNEFYICKNVSLIDRFFSRLFTVSKLKSNPKKLYGIKLKSFKLVLSFTKLPGLPLSDSVTTELTRFVLPLFGQQTLPGPHLNRQKRFHEIIVFV